MKCEKCEREVHNKNLVCSCGYQLINQREVFLCLFDNEIKPVVIVQNQKGNRYSPTTQVVLVDNYNFISTIDKSRLIKKIFTFSNEVFQLISQQIYMNIA